MEESEEEKREIEGVGLRLHIRKAETRFLADCCQASIGTRDLRAVENSLEKWESREKAACDLRKAYKEDAEGTCA